VQKSEPPCVLGAAGDLRLPDTLQEKLDLFRSRGRVFRENDELFGEESWIQVILGQGIIPQSYDPLVDVQSEERIGEYLDNVENVIRKCVEVMPTHAQFIANNCAAKS